MLNLRLSGLPGRQDPQLGRSGWQPPAAHEAGALVISGSRIARNPRVIWPLTRAWHRRYSAKIVTAKLLWRREKAAAVSGVRKRWMVKAASGWTIGLGAPTPST